MKAKFGNIQLSPIQELNKTQQKEVKGGTAFNPCCCTNPYSNPSNCAMYASATHQNFTWGSSACN